MVGSHHTRLESVDRATRTPIVRQALGSGRVETVNWDREAMVQGCVLA